MKSAFDKAKIQNSLKISSRIINKANGADGHLHDASSDGSTESEYGAAFAHGLSRVRSYTVRLDRHQMSHQPDECIKKIPW